MKEEEKKEGNWTLLVSDAVNELTVSTTTDSGSEGEGEALTSTIEWALDSGFFDVLARRINSSIDKARYGQHEDWSRRHKTHLAA